MVGDAVALPFSNGSFDVVSCCLFAHHLSPPDLVSFAREASRVARTAVLINDLIRDPLHLALVYAGLPLYRSRLTRNDAPASVRQAYTVSEMHRDATTSSVYEDRHCTALSIPYGSHRVEQTMSVYDLIVLAPGPAALRLQFVLRGRAHACCCSSGDRFHATRCAESSSLQSHLVCWPTCYSPAQTWSTARFA